VGTGYVWVAFVSPSAGATRRRKGPRRLPSRSTPEDMASAHRRTVTKTAANSSVAVMVSSLFVQPDESP